MKLFSKHGLLLVYALMSVLAGTLCAQAYPSAVGAAHPDFSAPDQDGQIFQLSAEVGKVVVLHYCALWCGPCIQSAQAEAGLIASIDAQVGAGNGIVIDAVIQNLSFGPTTVTHAQQWKTVTGTPARTLHLDGDANSELGLLGGQLTAFPTYVIIDPAGRVAKVIIGFSGPATTNSILSAVTQAWNSRPGPVVRTSTLSPGATQVPAGDAVIDSAIDACGGLVSESASYTLKPGFIGQLNDVAALSISGPSAVGEEEEFQLFAQGQMDDDTFLTINPGDVTWSPVSGPIASISASGLALAQAVSTTLTERLNSGFFEGFQTAKVRGEFGAFSAERDVDVFDFSHDNFGPVASDGIDDAWQFEFFDTDSNGILDPDEAALAAPDSDPDDDDSNNFIEWAGGYLPNSAASVLRFRTLGRESGVAQFEVSKMISGTLYRVVKSPTPAFDVFGGELEFQVDVDEENVQIEDPDATGPKGFYRLRLERDP